MLIDALRWRIIYNAIPSTIKRAREKKEGKYREMSPLGVGFESNS